MATHNRTPDHSRHTLNNIHAALYTSLQASNKPFLGKSSYAIKSLSFLQGFTILYWSTIEMWKKGWVFILACVQDPQVRPTHHLKKLRKNWGQRGENITNMRWKIRFRIKIYNESMWDCGMMGSILNVCARLCVGLRACVSGCAGGSIYVRLLAFRI